MRDPVLIFDHVHLISEDPDSASAWYVDILGGEIIERYERYGAPQILVAFQGATLIIRGQRTGEQATPKNGLQWGIDHFGFEIKQDFDAYCEALREKGVTFTMEPMDFTPTIRIAYIKGPDGVSIEFVYNRV